VTGPPATSFGEREMVENGDNSDELRTALRDLRIELSINTYRVASVAGLNDSTWPSSMSWPEMGRSRPRISPTGPGFMPPR